MRKFVLLIVVLATLASFTLAAPQAVNASAPTPTPSCLTTVTALPGGGTTWSFTNCSAVEITDFVKTVPQLQQNGSTAPVANGPAPAPVAPAPAGPASGVGSSGLNPDRCPSGSEIVKALGLTDVQLIYLPADWDLCHYIWQSNNKASVNFTVPDDMQVTASFSDKKDVAAYYGPVALQNVQGFSVRFLPQASDWVLDPLTLMAHENRYGLVTVIKDNYVTKSGNLIFNAVCPTTTGEVASIVGGNVENWITVPDWEGGAWVFKSNTATTLNVPNGTWIDYVDGQPTMSFFGHVTAKDAAFHCHLDRLPVTPTS
jgi:hypothetical protein